MIRVIIHLILKTSAQRVAKLFNTDASVGTNATQELLKQSPLQILHIGAHGEYDLNQPRMSRLHMADGPLFMDDLAQFQLDYELVVLAACSVGKARPSGGDELIGMSHRLLYAGAGAVVSSLWDVDSAASAHFFDLFYANLLKGLQHSRITPTCTT